MNLNLLEEAISNFDSELECLQNKNSEDSTRERARALGNLGDCYDSLGDYCESVKFHEQFLSLSLRTGVTKDQNKAYKGLGLAYKNLGNLQEALVILILIVFFVNCTYRTEYSVHCTDRTEYSAHCTVHVFTVFFTHSVFGIV